MSRMFQTGRELKVKWWGIVLALMMLHVPLRTSADWTLVVTHSNDLWYQLDEIQGDNYPCYEDLPFQTTTLPDKTSTEPTSKSTEPTTTSTEPTTTSTEPTTTSTETTTTSTEPTTTSTEPTTTSTEPTTTSTEPTTTSTEPTTTSTEQTTTSTETTTTSTEPTTTSTLPTQTTTVPEPTTKPTTRPAASTYGTYPPIQPVPTTTLSSSRSTYGTYPPLAAVKSFNSISDAESSNASRSCYGGVPRHLSKVTELRNESESKGKVFLHLNAGGMLGGNIWYPILGAGPVVESIKTLNYNAVALGYRDFEDGVTATVEYLKALRDANVTVLCANMDISREPTMKDLYKKSTVINIGGRKIGIIGYIGQDADYLADTGKIVFTDPVVAINKEITSMHNQSVHFIIALGSAGFDDAQLWMGKLFSVDLFVNGGSNTFLYNGAATGPLGEKVAGPYPIETYSQTKKRLFVQTSRYGKYLGKIELNINGQGRINNFVAPNPIILDSTVGKDVDLQYKVDEWERQVLTQANETIGYTKILIISDRKICWYTECTGATLMADAARAFLEKYTTVGNEWFNTVAATVWHGGALSDTDIKAGPITFGDILTMFPYANVLVNAAMNGLQIRKLFEESVSYYNDTTTPNRGEFLHVSGMRVEYDLSKPSGSRVASIYIRDTNNFYGGMAPLKDDQLYRVGMPSFIANGGSRFTFMENVTSSSTGVRDEIILREYIRKLTPLTYGNEGRVKFIIDNPTNCPKTNVTVTVFLTILMTLLFCGIYCGLISSAKFITDQQGPSRLFCPKPESSK